MPSQGVLYYNAGSACLVRLLVSAWSLRRHYDGPIVIASEEEAPPGVCLRIADAIGATFMPWETGVPAGRNRVLLAKTRYNLASPFDLTVALDSDTLVVGPIDELFRKAEEHEFCVARIGRRRSNSPITVNRMQPWLHFLTSDIAPAQELGPAINCGVLAFRRDAGIFRDWLQTGLQARDSFIPDEVCCQIILHRYRHHILDDCWNRSCQLGDVDSAQTRIIHYHGHKHCRPGLPFHAERWVAVFHHLWQRNVAELRAWAPAGDRFLARFLASSSTAIRTSASHNEYGSAALL